MDINFYALTYLFLRLAPFILVSFFSLSSIFNQDLKGLVYLVCLLTSTFVVMLGESVLPQSLFQSPDQKDPTCDFLNITNNSRMSHLPLGTGVISFTFAYLLYTIVAHGYTNSNVPTIIFFTLLLFSEIVWQWTHTCYKPIVIMITICAFALCGVLASLTLDQLKLVDLQYFTMVKGQEVCSRPSKQSFNCKVKAVVK
jgi:hypothetical protein